MSKCVVCVGVVEKALELVQAKLQLDSMPVVATKSSLNSSTKVPESTAVTTANETEAETKAQQAACLVSVAELKRKLDGVLIVCRLS